MKKRKRIRESDKKFYRNKKHSFIPNILKKQKYVDEPKYKGTMIINARGFGFCVLDDQDMEDVFVAQSNLNGAYNGDYVEIILTRTKGEKNKEGKVVNILKRKTNLVVGNFIEFKDGGYVEPDMRNINKDVFINKNNKMNAKHGDKVVAKIIDYGDEKSLPIGEIIEVIGDMSRKGDDIIAIIRNYELYEEFPCDVNDEVKNIPQSLSAEDYKGRTDFRNKLTCTIDGEDARDFDDAISIEETADGGFTLYVHIADVGNYVKRNSPIDKEAYNRGTSVYFPDMVLPMLPRELSNGICSLNPKEDRLALSVVINLDANANVIGHKICESVINSDERMTYTDVYAVLQGDANAKKKYESLVPSFLLMAKLSKMLEEKRDVRGALDFDLPETYVKVDEKGKTIDIVKRERNEAHRIIESFMILANEVVAKEYSDLQIPFVYRVHEKPTMEKMTDFFKFASILGYKTDVTNMNNVKPKDLQKIVKLSKEDVNSKTINEVMLRSLQKAKYFQNCLGHFGLASPFYCHFTSPIRRYPDLCIHRIIKDNLHGKLTSEQKYYLEEFVIDASNRSSEREKLAEKAERDVVAYKKCEYMAQFIGTEYEAYVSGVTSNGVFVALENTVEGFASVANMPDDVYDVDEKMFTFKGQHHAYVLGQKVAVKLLSVNMADRKIDFQIMK